MFGKKAKRIKELEGKIAHRDYADLERYNPLAADIIRRVDFEAADSDRFTSVDLESILQTVETQYRGDKLLKLFRELPPEHRLQFLLGAETDDEKKEMIQSALNEELAAKATRNEFGLLVEKAQAERRIDLSTIPKDASVKFLLYDDGDFDSDPSPEKIKREYYSDVKLLAISQGDGLFRIISTKYDSEDYSLSPLLNKPQDARLGTIVVVNGEQQLDTNAYFGASLSVENGAFKYEISAYDKYEECDTKLFIGRIVVNNKEIFIKS